MATGPGKYDDLCIAAMTAAGASTCVLLIIGGIRGAGFSLNSTDMAEVHALPEMLRATANQIEADLKARAS